MIISIVYLISIPITTMGILMIKKSKKELNLIVYFIISVLLTMCYQVAGADFVDKLGIEPSIYSIGILNYSLFVLLYYISKKRGIQKYQINISDVAAMITIAIVVFLSGRRQFGKDFSDFAYQSSCDCSRHLLFARQFAVNHEIVSIPFMAINTGLVIQSLYAFMEPYYDVLVMPITDAIMLFIAGATMWALIREKLYNKNLIFVGMIGTIFYLTGYPLNNMVFGTSYLGAGMTISLLIFTLICKYNDKEIGKYIFSITICLSFWALLRAYPLFFPIILVAVLVYYIIQYVLSDMPHLQKYLPYILIYLALLCGISIYLIFILVPYETNFIQILTMEGYIYKNLYGDFVFFFPFVLYRGYICYKEKNWHFDFIMIIFMICYLITLLYVNYIGRISSYYYYKNNYLLWGVLFYVLFEVLGILSKRAVQIITVYFFTVLVIVFWKFSSSDEKIVDTELKNRFLYNIYTWNYEHQGMETIPVPMDEDDENFYLEIAKITVKEGIQIPCINYTIYGDYEYYALGYQWEDFLFKWMDTKNALDRAAEDNYKYISIIYRHCKEIPKQVWEELSGYTKVYENKAGCIYQRY